MPAVTVRSMSHRCLLPAGQFNGRSGSWGGRKIPRMFSVRFQLQIQVTRHARERMAQRDMDDSLLLDLIETGTARYKDETHLRLFRHYEDRNDNLLCIAAVIQGALVVKTVMHHFAPED